jgi:hypothetical protein
MQRGGDLLPVALRSNDSPGVGAGVLEEGKEHGGLEIFGQGFILAVLHHAYHFGSVAAAPELEMSTNCLIDGS